MFDLCEHGRQDEEATAGMDERNFKISNVGAPANTLLV